MTPSPPLEGAVVRWTRRDERRIHSDKEIFDPDRLMALFEGDPDPVDLDHDLSGIADQLVAIAGGSATSSG